MKIKEGTKIVLVLLVGLMILIAITIYYRI